MAEMSKLLFVNRYFSPDESATSQLLSDLATELAGAGYRVEVVTSRQRYEDPSARLPAHESVRGVSVHRMWTSRWGRDSLLGRSFDYLTFYFSAGLWLLWHARRGDVIVAKTDPPLIGVVAAAVGRLKGARLVNWLQDFYPEVAEQLQVGGVGLASRWLKRLRDWSLRRAHMNVVIGRCMAEMLQSRGVRAERIGVIPNWVDDVVIRPLPGEGHPLRKEWELDGAFVIGYSGNMGRVHEFEALMDAVSLLVREREVRFLLIGTGARKNELRDVVEERDLVNTLFKPFQPQERLKLSLTAPDVHVVTLQHSLEGLIVPSKFYGAIAAGRPVIFLGPSGCEVARVIREWDCGFVIDHRDGAELARVVRALRDDPARCQLLGERARRAAEALYGRAHALAAWRAVVDGTAQTRPVAALGGKVSPETKVPLS
jgi:glycosyltransferase involved in cell wall biosynthesis